MSGDAPTPAHDPAAEGLEASVPLESVASMNSDEGQSSAQSAPLADNEARLQQLEQEHSSLREEHETLRSQYMRIAADFDNFRKRQSRDQDDLRLQLICTTLSEILPVVDNFERARQQL